MSALKKKLTSHVAVCQRCQKKLRVPVKPGKTLQVECVGCGLTFHVSFKNPFIEVFQYNPALSMKENLSLSLKRYGQLPSSVRLKMMFIFCAMVLFIILIAIAIIAGFML